MSTTYTPRVPTGAEDQGDPAADPRAFRRALGQFATGVAVVTTSAGASHTGMAVNSFAAVSLDPPLVSWSIRNESRSFEAFMQNGHFAVSVLAEDQVDTAALFGRPQPAQFEQVPHTAGLHGDRLLDNAVAHFECVVEATHEGGDHHILIGRVIRYTRLAGRPLLFSQGQYRVAEDHPQIKFTSAAPATQSHATGGTTPLFMSLLKSTDQRMSALFDEYRARLGVDVAGSRIINLLDVSPCSATELAERALLGEAAVEDTLRGFLSTGLVSGSAGGIYRLTAAGKGLRAELLRSAEEFTARKLKGIAPADLEAARRVLLQLMAD